MKNSVNHADPSINICRCSQSSRSFWKSINPLAKLTTFAKYGLQYFWRYFSQRQEPKIWQKRDRYGNLYWVVYDPTTGHSSCFSSEQEVRVWLEQRYYRS